ncbi:aspartyl protease [Nostoc sp. FACHB-87]|uniref:aspartyl protease n=1 Tax=Nostocaceae TaxID=1162 RepID=UPI00168316B1|nr:MULTISPECIES: aspartyl protease [Nostocaceae]MBD2455528.1 aspartyl protease [Nostoc sp. FACHB-87]MBD2478579.1 aspartyl protease [Anabaena sp. FACHB-83]
MIEGKFSSQGELIFEIDLVASDGLVITVDALLDTGFTDWLAINTQDAISLGWELVESEETRLTAQGEAKFNIYAGLVSLDNQEFNISAIAGGEITEVLIGLPWLFTRKLVVDFPEHLLTLG